MIGNDTELIRKFYSREITPQDFIGKFLNSKIPDIPLVIDQFQQSLDLKSPEKLEMAFALLFAMLQINHNEAEKLNPRVKIFQRLLGEEWHYHHEDLAQLLGDIGNENSISILCKSSRKELPYLEYDDTYQFARKCIKSISKIGGQEAVDCLQSLINSDNECISSYAKKELSRY